MPGKIFFKKLEVPFLSLVKISLRTKMVLVLVMMLMIAVATVSYFALHIVINRFNRMSEEQVQSAIRALSTELDLEKKDIQQTLVQTSKIVELKRKMMVRDDQGQIDYAGLSLQLSDIKDSAGLDFLELCSINGLVMGSGHEPGKVGEDRSSDPLIQSAARGKSTVSIVEDKLLSGNYLSVRAAVPIEHQGEVVGVLTGGYLLNRRFLEKFQQLSSSHVILLRPNAPAISSLSPSNQDDETGLKMDPDFVKRALNTNQPITETIFLSGNRYLSGTNPIIVKGKPLGVFVLMVSSKAIEQTVADLRSAFISLTVFAILFGVCAAYYIALRITRPIEALVDASVTVASGTYEVEIPVTGKDEISMLMSAFNYMTRELRENQKKLVTAVRMAEWQEVARRIAHEIKNPLTPITVQIEDLRRCYRDKNEDFDEVFEESTRIVLEEVHNLTRIVNEFSSFARMPKLIKEWTNIREILDSTVALYDNLQKNIQITIISDNQIPSIYVDPEQLRRAFTNLVKNAIDAMPNGGKLEIHLRNETVNDKSQVIVEFVDTGMGISADALKRLFIPYFSTKKKGTGLGLSIVEKIISEHDGTIQVESEVGKGSRFILHLPINPPEPPATPSTD